MKKILVVAPHPDDEMIGVGGTILKNIDEGNEVYVLVVTKGMLPLFNSDIIEKTRDEARRCHNTIGVKNTYFLDSYFSFLPENMENQPVVLKILLIHLLVNKNVFLILD